MYQIPGQIELVEKTKECQVCKKTKTDKFIKSKCGHDICFDCYFDMHLFSEGDSEYHCPICGKENWQFL